MRVNKILEHSSLEEEMLRRILDLKVRKSDLFKVKEMDYGA